MFLLFFYYCYYAISFQSEEEVPCLLVSDQSKEKLIFSLSSKPINFLYLGFLFLFDVYVFVCHFHSLLRSAIDHFRNEIATL